MTNHPTCQHCHQPVEWTRNLGYGAFTHVGHDGPDCPIRHPAVLIDDVTARRIASDWHNGQGSALYSLASTGAIHAGTAGEVIASMPDDDDADEAELATLLTYVNEHGERGRQVGWADLSW